MSGHRAHLWVVAPSHGQPRLLAPREFEVGPIWPHFGVLFPQSAEVLRCVMALDARSVASSSTPLLQIEYFVRAHTMTTYLGSALLTLKKWRPWSSGVGPRPTLGKITVMVAAKTLVQTWPILYGK